MKVDYIADNKIVLELTAKELEMILEAILNSCPPKIQVKVS